ncbi:MAG: hypothetical protein Q7S29_02225 [Candidatus Peribacter sp.]|nr:hypothetical protein [Candidatus Peribacter sp.]
MQRSSLLLTGGLLLALFSFGAADALLVDPMPAIPAGQASSSSASASSLASQPEEIPLPPSSEAALPLPEVPVPTPVDVLPPPPPSSETPPEGAVTKKSGLDPLTIVSQLNFTAEETDQRSLISAVVKEQSLVTTRVLLLNGDRAGLLAWIETPNVKEVFLVLKDSLHTLFSPEVRDLLDEMQSPAGKPPRNFLTFLDPALSEERFVFVRVRERLYEFHIAPGKDEAMYTLVEALTN